MAATSHALFSRVRLATPSDVPLIHKLIYQLAAFEHLTDECTATESSLSFTLLNSQPFHSVTVFILEASSSPFPESTANGQLYEPKIRILNLDRPIEDPERDLFKSDGHNDGDHDDDVVVAGFTLFFPYYPAFVGQPGFYVEDLFVRECYRKRGFGTMLLSCVANQAVAMGYVRLNWAVLDWNEDAIRFVKGFGARVIRRVRFCRLTGDDLDAYRTVD